MAHCLSAPADARQKVCNSMNKPTPTAGPSTVARTNIINDFATITLPRTKRRRTRNDVLSRNSRSVAGDPLKISADI